MLWGALWLYRATGEEAYLSKAQEVWQEFGFGEEMGKFDWDDKRGGAYVSRVHLCHIFFLSNKRNEIAN